VRFHTKFPWVQVFTGLIWLAIAYLDLHKPHVTSGIRAAYLVLAAFGIFLSGWAVASHFFIYWDLDSDALLERRFWNVRRIEYAAITNVGPWRNYSPSSGYLDIEFGKFGSAITPRTSVIANPLDWETFLNSLRRRAEQAEFTV
jgi:hypothetical protein